MAEGPYPVKWADDRAVVTMPEHIDVSNAGPISEQLLVVINRGAAELIVDMAATTFQPRFLRPKTSLLPR